VDRTLGVLIACAQEEGRFAERDLDLLVQIGAQVAIAVDNAQAFQEISELKDRIASEKVYLEEEIRGEHNFGEIVGERPALARVLCAAIPSGLLESELFGHDRVVFRRVEPCQARPRATFRSIAPRRCWQLPGSINA